MESLNLLLARRKTLLGSDDANLTMLRMLDRQILTMAGQGHEEVPVRDFSDNALRRLQELPLEDAVLWFEVLATLTDQDPRQAITGLLEREPESELGWWVAAHYPAVPVSGPFPVTARASVRAAYALWRRGRAAELPEPWRDWAEALSATGEPSEALLESLWQQTCPEQTQADSLWKDWFYPLLTRAPDEWQLWMVNWLSTRLDTAGTMEAMGISCARRFLGWLDAVEAGSAGNDALTTAARRELRWLRGDLMPDPDSPPPRQEGAGQAEGEQPHWWGRQAWGGGTGDQDWQRLFLSLPLAFRQRCWYWRGWCLNGGVFSLHGGQWCAGN